jgi:hypothetical protein
MNSAMWRSLCDEIPPEATPHELDAALRDTDDDSLTEDERAALWLYVPEGRLPVRDAGLGPPGGRAGGPGL